VEVSDQGHMLLCSDAVGALVGFWQARAHIGAELVDQPGTLSWSELATPDLSAAQRFYGAVCGHTFAGVDTGAGGPPYCTFSVGGRAVGGMLEMSGSYPRGLPPHWMPYFGVAGTDGAVARAEALGGVVHVAPRDSAFGRWAVVADPQGAVLTLVTMPQGAPA
jgi:uncharacterized protein